MVRRCCLAAFAAVFFATDAGMAAPLDFDHAGAPASLCATLVPFGLDAGTLWQESAARRGGWSCDRNGAVRECGGAGGAAAAGDLAYFVFGSGPTKVDRAILRLTMRADESGACRALLRDAADALSAAVGVRLPARIAALLTSGDGTHEPASGAATGRAGRRLLHEERQGWVRVRLTAERARLTVLTVTFENPNASKVWD